MSSVVKLNQRSADALIHFIKTLDHFGLMWTYAVTMEMKPKAYLNSMSNIEYEKPEKAYGYIIRIMNPEGTKLRIQIDEEEGIESLSDGEEDR